MKKVQMSENWMPTSFSHLKKTCLKYGGAACVTPMDLGFELEARPKPHVKLLTTAASKFRLAKYCEGLKEPDASTMEWEEIHPKYFERYSAPLIVTLSFVALETYLAMISKDWKDYRICRSGVDYNFIAGLLREDIGENGFKALIKAMEVKKLKARIYNFWSGDDREILAAISAIRNSFAHGKMGVRHSVGFNCAGFVRTFLLEMIEADIKILTSVLENRITQC